MSRWLPNFSVHRPVTVIMSFLALCVLGAIAWTQMPLEMMPGSFELAKMWVWLPYGDSSPRENERQIARPLEESVGTAPGIKRMRTRSRDDNVEMELEFHRSLDMDEAYNAVVDRLERAMPDLPDDVERYWIYRWDPADEPVIWAGMAIPEEVDDPFWLANELIAKKLERVPGVGKIDVWGVDRKAIFIDFHLDLLVANRIDLGTIMSKLGGDNFQLASGRLEDRGQVRYVRSLARYETVDEIRAFPLGGGLTLDDIADVEYRLDLAADINLIDGKEGAALAVNKESGANTVEVTHAVLAAFKELEADPRLAGTSMHVFFDQGELIQGSVDDLLHSAMAGGFFAVIVLFAFLRDWRLTLLIAACMPFTLLLTITLLYFTGRTLNLLSLMGLMLAVGMVVDNAIVVVEAIYARRQAGEGAAKAAVEGTAEVNLAITLSTLTTMVVFLPVILMSEDANFSFFMGELGMPVVYALGASLLVALIFTPLTTTFLRDGKGGFGAEPRWIRALTSLYQRTLNALLTHRTDTLVGVVAMLFLTFAVPVKAVGCQDSAEGNIGEFVIRYQLPGDLSFYERLDIVKTYEAFVDAHRDEWGVRVHRSRLSAGSTYGRTFVHLEKEQSEGTMPREEVIQQAKEELPQIPGVDAAIGWGEDNGPPPHQIRIVLRGEDTETLEVLGEEVIRVAEGLKGVVSAWPELEEAGGQEMRLVVDRDAVARYGLSAGQVGRTVAFAMRATSLPRFYDQGKEVEVVSRFQLEDRDDLDSLLEFPMWSGVTGQSVPLRAVVHAEVAQSLGTISREDRTTAWPITIDLERDTDKATATASLTGALSTLSFPRGYGFDQGDDLREDQENNEAQQQALLLSVVFVFLIMGVLFESFLLPMSVLTTIPMALLGVYWTLYFTGTPLDVMGGVGLVVLVGVVVNNGIVLIDLVTRLRHEGMSRKEALVEAGGKRLRPILMTALTTIFGLLPMATGSSSFIGIPYAPLGRVVAGGMVAGTVLTLFFLPYLYSVLDDMRGSGSRWLAWIVGRGPLAPRNRSVP